MHIDNYRPLVLARIFALNACLRFIIPFQLSRRVIFEGWAPACSLLVSLVNVKCVSLFVIKSVMTKNINSE